MEEKVLIKSERYNLKLLKIIMIAIPIALIIYGIFLNLSNDRDRSLIEDILDPLFAPNAGMYIDIGLGILVLVLLIFWWLSSYELTVTDKRVYGKVAFGKRVDLPVDSVSATSTISLFKGVSVSTSSGKISFLAIKNANEIYGVLNNLLVDRQKEKTQNTGTTIVQNSDEADKLKKFKDLLDSGVITQEEFDAKKKQLLGL